MSRADFDRVWLQDLTIDDFALPTTTAEAVARSARFKAVAYSEALRALAGRRLSRGEDTVYVDVLFDDDASLVYGFVQSEAQERLTEILELRVDPANGTLHLLAAEPRPTAIQADSVGHMFIDPYGEALGENLNAALQELCESRRCMASLGRELGMPRRRDALSVSVSAEEVRYWLCKAAVRILTEPGSDARCVADALVDAWTGSAPDLLATVSAILTQNDCRL